MPGKVESGATEACKLFIGGITPNTDEEVLKQFYSQWGADVTDVVVMRDPMTKRSRGFGFVSFAQPDQLDEAMNNRPHVIDNKEVEPKRAVPREFSNKPEAHMSVKRVYVSGIKEEHTEEMLREYFSQFGTVAEIHVVTDKNTGYKRGFAFVTFEDYDSADRVVLARSHTIDGKRCDVRKALNREETKKAQQQEQDKYQRSQRSRGPPSRGGRGGNGGGNYGYGDNYYGGGGGSDWNRGGDYGQQQTGGWGGQQSYGGGAYGQGGAAPGWNQQSQGGYGGGWNQPPMYTAESWQAAYGTQWGQMPAPAAGQEAWSQAAANWQSGYSTNAANPSANPGDPYQNV